MFVVQGRKRLRLWPAQYFRDRPEIAHSVDYEPYLDDAITLEGEPGDILYWPSGYWHIGESTGGLSLGLSVALFMNSWPSPAILDHASRMFEEHLSTSALPYSCKLHPRRVQECSRTITQAIKSATAAVGEVSRDPEFARALKISLLNRATSFGFATVPPPLPWRKLEDETIVRGKPGYPVVWIENTQDEIICSANGHAFSILAHPNILKLLELLNGGKAQRVRDLIEQYAGTILMDGAVFVASPEEIRSFIEKLFSLRALVKGGGI